MTPNEKKSQIKFNFYISVLSQRTHYYLADLFFSFLLFLFDLYQSWLEKIYILGALNLLQKGGPFANELLNFVSVYKKPS